MTLFNKLLSVMFLGNDGKKAASINHVGDEIMKLGI